MQHNSSLKQLQDILIHLTVRFHAFLTHFICADIIVGAAVAGVLLLFLLICTCFLCHKKYRGAPFPEEGSKTPPGPKTEPSQPK
jgi:hypothetical protein